MSFLRSVCLILSLSLFSLFVHARPPWEKSCSDCNSTEFVIKKDEVLCSACNKAIKPPEDELPHLLFKSKDKGENVSGDTSQAGNGITSLQSGVPQSTREHERGYDISFQLPLQDRRLLNLYLPEKAVIYTRSFIPVPLDVDFVFRAWAGAGQTGKDLERLTEVILEHWEDDNELRINRRLLFSDFYWKDPLSFAGISEATQTAMMMQDVLAGHETFQKLVADKKKSLLVLTLFELKIQRLLERRSSEASQAKPDPVSSGGEQTKEQVSREDEDILNEVSDKFVGMSLTNSQLYASRYSDAWERLLNALADTMGLTGVSEKQEFSSVVKKVMYAAHLSSDYGSSVIIPVSFSLCEEFKQQTRIYTERVLARSWHEERDFTETDISSALNMLQQGMVLRLRVGNVSWHVLRLKESFQLYLPAFWSVSYASSGELIGAIKSLHRSMLMAMIKPASQVAIESGNSLGASVGRSLRQLQGDSTDGGGVEVTPVQRFAQMVNTVANNKGVQIGAGATIGVGLGLAWYAYSKS